MWGAKLASPPVTILGLRFSDLSLNTWPGFAFGSAADNSSGTMKNALCEQLGIEYPIFAFTHCRDVVVEVSKAGGLGVLGAVGFSPHGQEAAVNHFRDLVG